MYILSRGKKITLCQFYTSSMHSFSTSWSQLICLDSHSRQSCELPAGSWSQRVPVRSICLASGRHSDYRSDHVSSSQTIIGVEIHRYCGETYIPMEVKDKLQNGNDVLRGQTN